MLEPLDPVRHAEIAHRAKIQIRKKMKGLRAAFSPNSLSKRSASICQRLLAHSELAQAKGVALFWPLLERGEVDLRELDSALRDRGVQLYYPFMDPLPDGKFRTGFRATKSQDELVDRGNKFLEPINGSIAQRGDLDLVLVPALAADAAGYRIGYGAGYYDATLGDICPPAQSWIVAFQFQLLAELPRQEHDWACERVITDESDFLAISANADRE